MFSIHNICSSPFHRGNQYCKSPEWYNGFGTSKICHDCYTSVTRKLCNSANHLGTKYCYSLKWHVVEGNLQICHACYESQQKNTLIECGSFYHQGEKKCTSYAEYRAGNVRICRTCYLFQSDEMLKVSIFLRKMVSGYSGFSAINWGYCENNQVKARTPKCFSANKTTHFVGLISFDAGHFGLFFLIPIAAGNYELYIFSPCVDVTLTLSLANSFRPLINNIFLDPHSSTIIISSMATNHDINFSEKFKNDSVWCVYLMKNFITKYPAAHTNKSTHSIVREIHEEAVNDNKIWRKITEIQNELHRNRSNSCQQPVQSSQVNTKITKIHQQYHQNFAELNSSEVELPKELGFLSQFMEKNSP